MKVYINVELQNWSSCRNMFCPLERKMEIDILRLNQFFHIEGNTCEPIEWLEWKQPTMASCWINFLQEYQTKKQKFKKLAKTTISNNNIRNICNATNKFKIDAINDATTWPKKYEGTANV